MVKKIILATLVFFGSIAGFAQVQKSDFKKECDSLTVLLNERNRVKSSVSIKKVIVNGSVISFNFNESIGDYPWSNESLRWFRKEVQKLLPAKYASYTVGELNCNRTSLNRYITPMLDNSGRPCTTDYRVTDYRSSTTPLVSCDEKAYYPKGLSGRHIALWQSHGRYFEQKLDRWEWQRATIFETVEDLYTQSYVVPFLVPMLENAGAVTILPRERDFNDCEVIADNDRGWQSRGGYAEKGKWEDAGTGFCDKKQQYVNLDNPFTMGTARKAAQKKGSKASATWSADIPERNSYAVYVSYKTLSNSTDCAHYTVHHLGGDTHFTVNQTMGGAMWVYLGSFELPEGVSDVVTLDCDIPQGHKSDGKYVTADAVKIGGGMGNIARFVYGHEDRALTSGMPRFTEGARYWLQWSGFDGSVWNQNELKHDYRDDFMCRGPWVQSLTGGSRINPKEEGKNIPVDLSFAFHTDAGTHRGDTIVGTLAIYTLLKDGKQAYTDGSDRQTAREYTHLVQSQVVDDIRAQFEPEWRRRQTWDRSYSESRMPNVPSMLLELLSHQNFADMKYGLDPAFRFTVSRAVYKGILKYLSNRYGCTYAVQPLPINSFAANFAMDGKRYLHGSDSTYTVRLRWKETPDTLEASATANGYLIYTKVDDGGWDNGVKAIILPADSNGGNSGNGNGNGDFIYSDVEILPGHRYSWKIVAYNGGGISFPSQVMSAGIPLSATDGDNITSDLILAVDNFDRVGAPTFYDSDAYAGFDNRSDSGMPYMYDCSYIGDMYEWHRVEPWQDDDCPGFGASYVDYADKIVAGNTFDWSERHGRLIFNGGRAFCSASAAAFAADPQMGRFSKAIDLICGKQVSTACGTSNYGLRHTVFTPQLQNAIRQYTSEGGNLLVSGSYIGTDAWSYVYPVKIDGQDATRAFCQSVLGFKWRTNFGSHTGSVRSVGGFSFSKTLSPLSFNTNLSKEIYRVESPDGIIPADSKGMTVLRYCDSNVSAGVLFNGKGYRCLSIGFPIETINSITDAQSIMDSALESICK